MFAHPEALWLLAAAPLPVLLHLLGTARPKDLVFPGVYLLRQMAARRRALRLRHLLVLLLRTAAIVAAAIICAGPRSSQPLPLLSSQANPVLALDASASMGSGDGTAWHQAVRFVQALVAKGQRPKVLFSPPQPGHGTAQMVPAQPSRSQGALADAILAAGRQGLLVDGGPVYVVTDLDASTVLPRRWPPSAVPAPATIIACASPVPGIYAVRHRPWQPVAGLPATLSCYMRPADEERLLRASDNGVPVAAARAAPSTRSITLSLGKLSSGHHTLEISARPARREADGRRQALRSPAVAQTARKYPLRVSEAAGVAVVAGGQAAQILTAAVDPQEIGRPFFITALPRARLVIADGTAPVPSSADSSAFGGLILFAGPATADWLQACGLRGGAKPAGAALPADQARSLRVAADAPPAWRGVMELFRPALESARFFRPARLQLSSDWWVMARFSDGQPAIAWTEAGRWPVLLVGFPPVRDATDLVASGAFAALLHACLAEMLPPDTAPSSPAADNPPPAELAGARATADGIRTAWGPRTRVVEFGPGLDLPPQRGPADLAPLMVLIGLALLGSEWLLSQRLSAA